MKKYLYWATNIKSGESYNFCSLAKIAIGTLIKDEEGNECIITDYAVESPLVEVPRARLSWGVERGMSR